MKNDDVALIRRILAGNETAFAELVKKYQKQVHVLAWRKIGDFHIAEDITQDVFLKVYQQLHALKNPKQFSGWLYVITTRLCATCLRKNRIQTQPLEDTEITMIQSDAYSQHVVEERANTAVETQREVVKRLLAKLKESERTVMALHYLGEMTVEEISKFLGVSAGTIKSRLQRARNRLQKEETMIREALDHFQISPNLTDNIMREVARLKPIAPSGGKPLVPWVIGAASAVLIVLMLGIGSQYLTHFQKPYSLDAQAETAVELVDAPIVLNLEATPDVRRQFGNINALGPSDNNGQKPDEILLAAAQSEGEDIAAAKQQWIQSEPVKGSAVKSLLATPEGELYVLDPDLRIYKLPVNGKRWQHIFNAGSLKTLWATSPRIAKWKNTLYIISLNELFASNDDGKTWDLVYSWSKVGHAQIAPIELILTEHAFYAAFESGIFRSEDKGKTWKALSKGLRGRISALVKIQHVLFTATDTGLYRLDPDLEIWEHLKLPISLIGRLISVTATEEKLYVAVELMPNEVEPQDDSRIFRSGGLGIFRSTDLGDSWKDITPTNSWSLKGGAPTLKLVAAGEILLAMEHGMLRSIDGGNTWAPLQLPGTSPYMASHYNAVVNKNTIYVGSSDGLHCSTNGGKSWDIVRITQDKRRRGMHNIIAYKGNNKRQNMPPTLYVGVGQEIVKTTDKGKSWETIKRPNRRESAFFTQMIKSDEIVYTKVKNFDNMLINRVSADGNTLAPIQGMPILDLITSDDLFDCEVPDDQLPQKVSGEQLQESFSGATQFFKQLDQILPQYLDIYIQLGYQGSFAVSGDTFYMEYNFKLFRWEPGDTEWYDTEQEETVELTLDIAQRHLKLAVSGNTVYVGKRDGHLVVSFDKGTNWIDLTPALPFPFKTFKDIVFAGSTVYVATDAGVAASDDGRHWGTVTDAEGTNLVMEQLAVDGTTLYGVTQKTGIYRLESGTWQQIVSETPDKATSLAVDGDTLYIGTQNNGMLHFNLEK